MAFLHGAMDVPRAGVKLLDNYETLEEGESIEVVPPEGETETRKNPSLVPDRSQ